MKSVRDIFYLHHRKQTKGCEESGKKSVKCLSLRVSSGMGDGGESKE